jgi:hypothetical protein
MNLGADATRSSLPDTQHPLALLDASVLCGMLLRTSRLQLIHTAGTQGIIGIWPSENEAELSSMRELLIQGGGPLSIIDKHKGFLPHIPSLGTAGV